MPLGAATGPGRGAWAPGTRTRIRRYAGRRARRPRHRCGSPPATSPDEPGQDAVLDRLLDLVLVPALRAWCARPVAPHPRGTCRPRRPAPRPSTGVRGFRAGGVAGPRRRDRRAPDTRRPPSPSAWCSSAPAASALRPGAGSGGKNRGAERARRRRPGS
ncbi:cupin domain-containing protein [Microbispora sp. NPDC088329]|uniref:cupin domain-containing protein n=1 Tax=Microbispora sp. NPDC088329 TaxID=3154869 RepID=UPI003445D48D